MQVPIASRRETIIALECRSDMRRVSVLMLFWSNAALLVSANAQQRLALHRSAGATPDARARQLLAAMTTNEKILLLAGHHSEDKTCGNYIGRVGSEDCASPMNHSIPELHLNDAGQGFRDENNSKPGSSTQWPSAPADSCGNASMCGRKSMG